VGEKRKENGFLLPVNLAVPKGGHSGSRRDVARKTALRAKRRRRGRYFNPWLGEKRRKKVAGGSYRKEVGGKREDAHDKKLSVLCR